MFGDPIGNHGFGNRDQALHQGAQPLRFLQRTAHVVSMIVLFASIATAQQSQPPVPASVPQRQQQQPERRNKLDGANNNEAPARDNSPAVDKVPDARNQLERQTQGQQRQPDAPQQYQSDWTGIAQAAAAITNVLVTVAILWVYHRQWRVMHQQAEYMRDGLVETRKAGTAAKESADTARNGLLMVQRPFVAYEGCDWFWHKNPNTGTFSFSIEPKLKNSGPLPTKDLRVVVAYNLRDAELPKGFDFPLPGEIGACFIAAQASFFCARGSITADDLKAVQKREKWFYVWGRAEYHDWFEGSPMHTSRFCIFAANIFGTPDDPADNMRMSFHYHSQHNSAD